MLLLQAKNLTKYYGTEEIFSHLSFSIEVGEKIGLVGANGTGKTTFLKCITGQEIPEEGEITWAENTRLGYLEQIPDWSEKRLLMQEMLGVFSDLIEIKNQMTNLEKQMGEGKISTENLERLMERYSSLTEQYERAGGYQYENKIKRIVKGLGFTDQDFEANIRNFSGGQKTRLSLAKLLVREPEILILDEPTNHLDVEAIEWLEQYLQEYKGALLIVSHDRFFLDRVIEKTIELERGKLSIFKGNYSRYLQLKAQQQVALSNAYQKQQREIRKTEEYIDRYRAGIKAKQARGRQSILNRLKRIEAPSEEQKLKEIKFSTVSRSGERVLDVYDLEKEFTTTKVLQGVTFSLSRGEKVGIVGANGTGKSTILKIIAGELEQTDGEILLGSQVKISYFSQEYENLVDNNQVLDEIIKNFVFSQEEARNLLARFLFTGDDIFKTVKNLSGGEKGRLALLKALLARPNFLLLDEPTNHLDIPAKQAVEEALINYQGTILVVSHDRYFLDQVVERILELKEGIVENYLGNYSYYREVKERRAKELTIELSSSKREKKRNNLEVKEKQKHIKLVAHLEERINSLEEKIAALNNELSLPEVYTDGLKTKYTLEEIKNLQQELQNTYEEWESLI